MDLKAMTNHSDFFADVNSLQSMKVDGNTKTKAGLEKVAKEFESLYLKMMLDSMRKAEDVWAKDNPFHSREQSMFRDMLDGQYAKDLSDSGSLGIAEMLVKQLSPFVAGEQKSDGAGQSASGHQIKGENQMKPLIDLEPKGFDVKQNENQGLPLHQGALMHNENLTPDQPSGLPMQLHHFQQQLQQSQLQEPQDDFIPGDPDSFIKTMMPYAEKAAAQLGVDPKLLVSQAALETGWGKTLAQNNHGNNLFGIKQSSQWQGEVNIQKTSEYVNGKKQTEYAAFKSYDSLESSFNDYANLIQNRYLANQSETVSADEYVQQLANGGYATDPEYANKILTIYKSARLNQGVNSYQNSQPSQIALTINRAI